MARWIAGVVIIGLVAAVTILHIWCGIQERKEYGDECEKDDFWTD